MIHHTTQGGKFKRLVRLLRPLIPPGCPITAETLTVGVLERLWHATLLGAQRGDIGRFDNAEIAEDIGWHGDADTLIGILIDEHWLDPHPTCRLVVHDWHEHAPKHIKASVSRLGGFLSCPRSDLEPALDTELACDPPMEVPCLPTVAPNTPKVDTPNRTEPDLTKPNPTDRPEGAGVRAAVRELGALPTDPIILGPGHWRESQPTRERIARVVSGDPGVNPTKLRESDRELCIRAAAVHHWGEMPPGWLDGVLQSMQARRTPLDNRWAFFRGALIKAAERGGKNYHDVEARIVIPPRHLAPPAQSCATPVAG